MTRSRKKTAGASPPRTPPTLASGTVDDGSDVDEVGERRDKIEIEELRAEIDRQREVISLLTSRLNFVLTMFGIDEIQNIPSKQESVTLQSEVSVTNESSDPVKARITPTASFQSAVLSTVYQETKQQEVRSKNFVIYGLPVSPSQNDQMSVEQLCEAELNLKPVISSCKRIGKKVPGKVQALKVTVRTAEQATSVIASARNLRKSADRYIQGSVYINADLTKAQAAAAYQARCRRRQAQAARDSQSNQQNVLRPDADEYVPPSRS